MKIKVLNLDATEFEADAIVNPANSYGYMGGGLAGALKKVGGQEIELEAVSCAPIPLGYAIMTTAGKLRYRKVIHAPTMEQPAGLTNIAIVKEAVTAALQCADEAGIKRLAIPGMGTGVGEIPKNKAAAAILEAVINFEPKSIEEVILIDKDKEMVMEFEKLVKNK